MLDPLNINLLPNVILLVIGLSVSVGSPAKLFESDSTVPVKSITTSPPLIVTELDVPVNIPPPKLKTPLDKILFVALVSAPI